ncbi:hypothetical protein EMPG_12304 [Blastomyces silverae]|uniref:Uncharacterized protein n=1 Tax=Blastomyces silverae TaxID=2060906 RepID=A0A0H1BNU8_9EURO|nr:hypothetical protein EMPG_12304 [Blastomyces silverae]
MKMIYLRQPLYRIWKMSGKKPPIFSDILRLACSNQIMRRVLLAKKTRRMMKRCTTTSMMKKWIMKRICQRMMERSLVMKMKRIWMGEGPLKVCLGILVWILKSSSMEMTMTTTMMTMTMTMMTTTMRTMKTTTKTKKVRRPWTMI